jgi:LysM repeat protein
MSRSLLFILILVSIAFAKTLIECRVITKGVKECDPYSTKSLAVKDLQYENEKEAFLGFRSSTYKKDSTQDTSRFKNRPDFWKYLENRAYHNEPESEDTLEMYAHSLERYVPEDKRSKKPALKSKEEFTRYIQQLENYAKMQRIHEEAHFGVYTVEQGDVLSRIAKAFEMKTAELRTVNYLKKGTVLHIGQKLKVRSSQEMVDAIASCKYKVKPNDTLIAIAKKFKLSVQDLANFNKIKTASPLVVGKTLKLPLPYKIGKGRYITYGAKSLRVTATAYTSHAKQTDDTPFLAAWNNRLVPGMKSIAVSRDLLAIYGMRNGTKVRISGLPGVYRVRDKMNKRYKRRIDIYMGLDRQKALQWGRRSVKIYWD